MRELDCGQATGLDCQEVVHGETDDEVMQKAGEHAASAHGMTEMSPEMDQKLRSMIHDA